MNFKLVSSILFFVGAGVLPSIVVSAQSGAMDGKSVVHISFIPPLSTHGLNAPSYTNAFSLNMLIGISKNEKMLTFGGLSNIIKNDAHGFQFAGVYNYVGNEGNGVLLSGLVNLIKNRYAGTQLAGILNVVREAKGIQLSGLVNVAEDVKGCQFAGLVNVAKNVSGLQFSGLVNVAEVSNWPIGLINLIREGEKGISLEYTKTGSSMVLFRSGGKYTYGILGMGVNHKNTGQSLLTTGGFGAHVPLSPRVRINNEFRGETIGGFSKKNIFKVGYALMPALKVGSRFELFGGPSINYWHMRQVDGNKDILPKKTLWEKSSASKLRQLYMGYQVGVQCIL